MARKRANGEGSIVKRKDGKGWQGQLTVGRDPKTGKLKRQTFYGKTQKEVQQKMSKVKNELDEGNYIEANKITVAQWFDRWLNDYKKPPNIKPSTYASYEMQIRRHLKPKLGHILLKDLRPDMLQRFYNEKSVNGRADGTGGLSNNSIRNMHNMIHGCLQKAVDSGLINKNVSEATTLPKVKRTKEIRVLKTDEMQNFLQLINKDRMKCAFILLLGSGMRLGELLGLAWDDVDLESGVIRVRRSLNRVKSLDKDSPTKTKLIFQEPKTEKGKRNIPLSSNVLEELKLHKERQDEEKSLAEGIYNDLNLVFCSNVGTPYDPRCLIRKLHNICSKAKIPRINIHALRHTYATRLLEANQHPKIVQELLGHSNISTTLDTYSHVMPEMKKAAVQTLDKLFDEQ